MTAEAAAFHGLATNQAYPVEERLALALKALELYEAECDAMRPVVEAARAYLAFQRTVVVPGIDSIPHEFIRLAAAVDALDGAS